MEAFNKYFLDTLKNRYAQFNGRATRSEFWYFVLFNIIGTILLNIIDGILGTNYTYEIASSVMPGGTEITAAAATQSIGYLSSLYGLILLIPGIAVAIRRLHDIGKSGWWILLGMIPIVNFIGIFVLIYFYVLDSQPGENIYGPNPKGV